MTDVFGPNTRGVIHLISHLGELGRREIDSVVDLWKRRPREDRAAAWAAIGAVTTLSERQAILDAAGLARREAMTVARRHGSTDWAFWAAVWDAAAGVAARDRLDEYHYRILVGPVASGLPWLASRQPDRVEVSGLQAAITRYGVTQTSGGPGEVGRSADVSEAADVSGAADVTDSTGASRSAEVSESADVGRAADVSGSAEVGRAADVTGAAEVGRSEEPGGRR